MWRWSGNQRVKAWWRHRLGGVEEGQMAGRCALVGAGGVEGELGPCGERGGR